MGGKASVSYKLVSCMIDFFFGQLVKRNPGLRGVVFASLACNSTIDGPTGLVALLFPFLLLLLALVELLVPIFVANYIPWCSSCPTVRLSKKKKKIFALELGVPGICMGFRNF